MAYKKYFLIETNQCFSQHLIEYDFIPGIEIDKRQKNIQAVHQNIQAKYPNHPKKILEVSNKSQQELGRKLTSYNLCYKGKPVECWFQASKCFNHNKNNNLDLLDLTPTSAKRIAKSSGILTSFLFEGEDIPLIPTSLCFDYIYCKALYHDQTINKDELVQYDCFTDIGYLHKHHYNCQARSLCIFVSLYKHHLLDEALKDIESFEYIVHWKQLG